MFVFREGHPIRRSVATRASHSWSMVRLKAKLSPTGAACCCCFCPSSWGISASKVPETSSIKAGTWLFWASRQLTKDSNREFGQTPWKQYKYNNKNNTNNILYIYKALLLQRKCYHCFWTLQERSWMLCHSTRKDVQPSPQKPIGWSLVIVSKKIGKVQNSLLEYQWLKGCLLVFGHSWCPESLYCR